MNRRQPPKQPGLFADPPVQPRYVEAEPLDLYEAILRARRNGFKVFRVGRARHAVHELGGPRGAKVMSAAELKARFGPGFWNPNR